MCDGTGFRKDSVGRDTREKDPTYTCNGCGKFDAEKKAWAHGPNGPGRCVKWPTSWARHDGDILPVGNIPNDLTCHTLIVGDKVFHIEEWNGEAWRKTEFKGDVLDMLAYLGIKNGALVTVDYHS